MKARHNRWWNFPSTIILFAALMMTALKIQSTNWTDDLHLINWLTFIGFLLGVGVGYSKFRTFFSRLLIIVYSILIVPYAIGTTYNSSIPWLTRFESIYGRIYFSIDKFINNVRIDDPILFVIFLTFLVWITAITAGFLLTRTGQPWVPILISGVTIFTAEFYDQLGNNLYTAFFIFFILVYISQNYYLESNRKWKIKGIPVDFETEPLIRRSALIVTFLIVLIAWNSTDIVAAFQKGSQQQKQVISFVEDIQTQFSRLTAPLEGTAFLRSEFYGDTVNLGTGSNLSDEIVLEISVDQEKPSGSRYYWRARSYDQFMDNQWTSSFESNKIIEANTEISDWNEYLLFPLRTFSFKMETNLSILYTPPNPQLINRPVKAYFNRLPDEKNDYLALTLEDIAYPGESYEIIGRIPTPTIAQMRNSSQDYPDWVVDYYLQLPPDFSEKIRELAVNLTENYSNPYDKSLAITNYLRNNITYNEQIPEPPLESDLIEWFLFEHQEGFCNYYATSQVLMLRSVGIPARIVFGYAQGEPQNEQETEFIVRKEQSHAWPEVFFTGIGWVEFEPTTIQPTIDRLLGDTISPITDLPSVRDPNRADTPLIDGGESIGIGGEIPDQTETGESIPTTTSPKQPLFPFILMGIVILYSIILMFKGSEKEKTPATPVVVETFLEKRGYKVPLWLKQWALYAKLTGSEKAFSKIVFSLLIFNKDLKISSTPTELVEQYKKVFPEKSLDAEDMLREYHRAIYSQQPTNLQLLQDYGNLIIRHTILMKIKGLFKFEKRYS